MGGCRRSLLAGVSRMVVSLAVIMFELMGVANFIPPFVAAVLTGKWWVAGAIIEEGTYDPGQYLLGLPFFDMKHGLARVDKAGAGGATVEDLIPPKCTTGDTTVRFGARQYD